jgi:hypothetical protein
VHAALASTNAPSSLQQQQQQLELVCSYPLFGVIESLAVLKGRSERVQDALVLCFRFAVTRVAG